MNKGTRWKLDDALTLPPPPLFQCHTSIIAEGESAFVIARVLPKSLPEFQHHLVESETAKERLYGLDALPVIEDFNVTDEGCRHGHQHRVESSGQLLVLIRTRSIRRRNQRRQLDWEKRGVKKEFLFVVIFVVDVFAISSCFCFFLLLL